MTKKLLAVTLVTLFLLPADASWTSHPASPSSVQDHARFRSDALIAGIVFGVASFAVADRIHALQQISAGISLDAAHSIIQTALSYASAVLKENPYSPLIALSLLGFTVLGLISETHSINQNNDERPPVILFVDDHKTKLIAKTLVNNGIMDHPVLKDYEVMMVSTPEDALETIDALFKAGRKIKIIYTDKTMIRRDKTRDEMAGPKLVESILKDPRANDTLILAKTGGSTMLDLTRYFPDMPGRIFRTDDPKYGHDSLAIFMDMVPVDDTPSSTRNGNHQVNGSLLPLGLLLLPYLDPAWVAATVTTLMLGMAMISFKPAWLKKAVARVRTAA